MKKWIDRNIEEITTCFVLIILTEIVIAIFLIALEYFSKYEV